MFYGFVPVPLPVSQPLYLAIHPPLTNDCGVKLDVSHVQDAGEQLEHLPDVRVAEHEHLHGGADVGELGSVVTPLACDGASLQTDG